MNFGLGIFAKKRILSIFLLVVVCVGLITVPSYAEQNYIFMDEFDAGHASKASKAFYSSNIYELNSASELLGDYQRASRIEKNKEGVIIYEAENIGAIQVRGGIHYNDTLDFRFSYSFDNTEYTELKPVIVNAGTATNGYKMKDYFFAGLPTGKIYFKITIPVEGDPWNKQIGFLKIETNTHSIIEEYDAKLMDMFNFNTADDSFYELTEGAESEEELRLVYALGLIDQKIMEESRFDTPITRGEFAYSLTKLVGIDKGEFSYGNYYDRFSDVDSLTDYAYNIQFAAEMGYLSKKPDGSFRPEENVHENDAIYAIMSFLGYRNVVDVKNAGDMYKLASNISLDYKATGRELTVRKAAELIVAALNARTAVYGWNDRITIGDNSYIKTALKLERVEGQMTYSKYGSVSGSDYDDNDIIEIDGNVVYTTSDYFKKNVGKNVWAYLADDNGRKTVVTFGNTHLKAEPFTVLKSDLYTQQSDMTMVRYDENGREKKKGIRITKLVVNGERTYDLSAEKMYDCDTITFIDGDGNGVYETAFAEKYRDYFIKAVYYSEKGLSDLYTGETFYLDAKKYDHINIIKDGNTATFAEFKENVVVSIAVSENNKFVRAVVSDGSVEGTVSRNNPTENMVRIGNKEYYISPSLIDKIEKGKADMLQSADEGIFYLNALSQISGFSSTTTRETYGFMINCGVAGPFADTLIVKLFETNGKISEIECTDTVKIAKGNNYSQVGGAKAKEILDTADALRNRGKTEGLIRYKKNKEGKITFISIPKTAKDDDVFSLDYSDSAAYSNGTDLINAKYAIDENTVRFFIPYDREETERYRNETITKSGYRGSQYKYDIRLYDTNSVCFAGAIVLYENENDAYNLNLMYNNLSYVSDVMTSYDETRQEARKQFKIMTSGVEKEYYAADNLKIVLGKNSSVETDASTLTADDIEKGDIVTFATNQKGEIGKIILYYNRSDKLFYKSDKTSSADFCVGSEDEYVYIYAELEFKYREFVKLNVGTEDFFCKINSANIALYEDKGANPGVKKGTVDDITKGDKVVVRMTRGSVTDMMVIR